MKKKVFSYRQQVQDKGSLYTYLLFPVFILFILHSPLFIKAGFAGESHDSISADRIEYSSDEKKYFAKGSVVIQHEEAVMKADSVIYSEVTSEVLAEGNVHYDDKDAFFHSGRAEFNMEAKTGRLYNAEVFYKKTDHSTPEKKPEKKDDQIYYSISGKEIEKRGDKDYYSPDAAFTTCSGPVPAWCFKGKQVNLILGEQMNARHTTFRIRNLPILYAPYLWAPIITERQTGFIMPGFGFSKSRGMSLNLPFFWAISENRDATFVLDMHSKRGIGAGLEYRFVNPGGVKSNWWAYHIRDSDLNKDYWEIKASHENRSSTKLGGFLNMNYVNEKDYYREFSSHLEVRTQRFLESTGEIEAPLKNARIYLLSQYWIDLKHNTGDVPQRLPELGYVLHYKKTGGFLFSVSLAATHFWRDQGLSARRIDLYPALRHSFGKDFIISQKVNMRGTFYSFYKSQNMDNTVQRSAFEYDILGYTRLSRNYSSFTHVLEPGIRYHFISASKNNLQVFDSSEMFRKTSRFELSLLNRFILKGREIMTLRISQGVETYNGDRPFLPLTIEAGMNSPFPLKMDASYDVHKGRLDTISSDLGFQIYKANLWFGQRYNRGENTLQYRTGIVIDIDKSLQLAGRLWYDAKGKGLGDMNLSLRYLSQCWGIRVEFVKKPKDYSMLVMYELTGLISNMSKR